MFLFNRFLFWKGIGEGVHCLSYFCTLIWIAGKVPHTPWRPCHHWFVSHDTLNTLRPRQNGRHFADDTFKHIFLNESTWISFEISLNFVPKSPINNIPALVQIMAWRRPGDKPLFEPMMIRLHICVTRPQWVNVQRTTHSSTGIHIEGKMQMTIIFL